MIEMVLYLCIVGDDGHPSCYADKYKAEGKTLEQCGVDIVTRFLPLFPANGVHIAGFGCRTVIPEGGQPS